ncbi:MAG: CHC2 zinc finger domain-containing protein [Clostridiales bacterium]|nr:CHC2 zinc finger domain-containing protein [Clostridiales bacterium]
MTSVFEEIREQISARQAAERYGLEIDRYGKARCAFHSPDTHPSMSFKGNFFRCWSCDAQGDAVKLVTHLFSLKPIQAARRIDADFGLGLFDNQPVKPKTNKQAHEEQFRIEADRTLVNNWQNAERAIFIRLCNISIILNKIKRICGPVDPDTEIEPLFILAIRHLDGVEHCLEILIRSTESEKISNFWDILYFVARLEVSINENFSASGVAS